MMGTAGFGPQATSALDTAESQKPWVQVPASRPYKGFLEQVKKTPRAHVFHL